MPPRVSSETCRSSWTQGSQTSSSVRLVPLRDLSLSLSSTARHPSYSADASRSQLLQRPNGKPFAAMLSSQSQWSASADVASSQLTFSASSASSCKSATSAGGAAHFDSATVRALERVSARLQQVIVRLAEDNLSARRNESNTSKIEAHLAQCCSAITDVIEEKVKKASLLRDIQQQVLLSAAEKKQRAKKEFSVQPHRHLPNNASRAVPKRLLLATTSTQARWLSPAESCVECAPVSLRTTSSVVPPGCREEVIDIFSW